MNAIILRALAEVAEEIGLTVPDQCGVNCAAFSNGFGTSIMLWHTPSGYSATFALGPTAHQYTKPWLATKAALFAHIANSMGEAMGEETEEKRLARVAAEALAAVKL